MNAYPREHRVFGSAGAGKTKWLEKEIAADVAEYGEEAVMVSSFSRAGATEIASRAGLRKSPSVGTLHSICYNAISPAPNIAEQHVDDWNQSYPSLAISERAGRKNDPIGNVGGWFADYNLRRARLEKEKLNGAEQKWEEWKKANELLDFSDLLEIALRDFDTAPGKPKAAHFDEAQDFTPLMTSIVRKWGAKMEKYTLAGDDDQTIYTFMGATADCFLDGTPGRETILPKSHRCTQNILDWALSWVSKVRNRKFKDVTSAREGHGRMGRLDFSLLDTKSLTQIIDRETSHGRSVMVLATCAYMLVPALRELREAGIPFSNKYASAINMWNPYPKGSAKRQPAWKHLEAFLDVPWTGGRVELWRKLLKHDAPGVRRELWDKKTANMPEVWPHDVFDDDRLMVMDTAEAAKWYRDNADGRHGAALDTAVSAAQAGRTEQMGSPLVTVGTIHSVKGGEADVVILAPDLSGISAKAADPDDITRLFFVGATRARDHVMFLKPMHNHGFVKLG